MPCRHVTISLSFVIGQTFKSLPTRPIFSFSNPYNSKNVIFLKRKRQINHHFVKKLYISNCKIKLKNCIANFKTDGKIAGVKMEITNYTLKRNQNLEKVKEMKSKEKDAWILVNSLLFSLSHAPTHLNIIIFFAHSSFKYEFHFLQFLISQSSLPPSLFSKTIPIISLFSPSFSSHGVFPPQPPFCYVIATIQSQEAPQTPAPRFRSLSMDLPNRTPHLRHQSPPRAPP